MFNFDSYIFARRFSILESTSRISTKWMSGLDVRDGIPSMSAACQNIINAAPHSADNGDWRKAKRPMQNEDFSASRI